MGYYFNLLNEKLWGVGEDGKRTRSYVIVACVAGMSHLEYASGFLMLRLEISSKSTKFKDIDLRHSKHLKEARCPSSGLPRTF